MMKPLYLDYAATTPAAPEVAQLMGGFLTLEGCFANPASRTHLLGWEAEQAVEKARRQLGSLLNADPRTLVWTSGATEASNLAIIGSAYANPDCKHLITSRIEHKSVLDTCRWLEQQGWSVTWLEPNRQGCIRPEQVANALRDDTLLVSLMLINNELGSINPIADIAHLLAATRTLLHVDGAQAIGKYPLDVQQWPIDLLSISAHKFYGPKGVGALYVRQQPKRPLQAILHGGGHEQGRRSGTLPTHQLAGMGLAAELAQQQMNQDAQHLQACQQAFIQQLNPDFYQSATEPGPHWPGILNLIFPGVEAETLLMAVPGLAVSTGSACNSASLDPSYVLTGIGVPRAHALSAVRFSFGRYLSVEQAGSAGLQINQALERLRTPSKRSMSCPSP